MNIYHGSKQEIKSPIIKGSNDHNDYGPSFYMTMDLASAKAWACRNNILGIVNEYFIDSHVFNNLKILDLTDKSKYSVLNWLAILIHFRTLKPLFIKENKYALDYLEKYYIDVNDFDVVKGYRADDAYFRFPISFIQNDLSFNDLEKTYLSGNLGIQYAFMSERAIKALKFVRTMECEEYQKGRYFDAVVKATNDLNQVLSLPRDPSKTYILDLIRKENE